MPNDSAKRKLKLLTYELKKKRLKDYFVGIYRNDTPVSHRHNASAKRELNFFIFRPESGTF